MPKDLRQCDALHARPSAGGPERPTVVDGLGRSRTRNLDRRGFLAANKVRADITVIAMTREIGSFGNDVAAGLAARLKLEVIQSDTVANSIGERLGVDANAVLRYVNGSAPIRERWQIDRRRLFHYAAEEIVRLAQQDDALIKGWGVATLLRHLPGVISVRVCAPMDFRIKVLMERLVPRVIRTEGIVF